MVRLAIARTDTSRLNGPLRTTPLIDGIPNRQLTTYTKDGKNVQTLPMRLGKAIGEHLRVQDEANAEERTDEEAQAALIEIVDRVLTLKGKMRDIVLVEAFEKYTWEVVPRGPRNGATPGESAAKAK